jgi:hypothetical protein
MRYYKKYMITGYIVIDPDRDIARLIDFGESHPVCSEEDGGPEWFEEELSSYTA